MARVYLSYSRNESSATVNRIAEYLQHEFRESTVYRARDELPSAGSDFSSNVKSALEESDLVIVLIGPNWMGKIDPGREDPSGEAVRREVELALERGKEVVPVLIDGAAIRPQDLPESIRAIASRQFMEVHTRRDDFDVDMKHLIQALENNTKAFRDRRVYAPAHQSVAMPLHILIVATFGLLALICIGGGIYAIVVKAAAQSTLGIGGMTLQTEHVGVAFVGIGLFIAFLTVRSVLKSQHDLAKLPSNH
jgi:hypothetical protein